MSGTIPAGDISYFWYIDLKKNKIDMKNTNNGI